MNGKKIRPFCKHATQNHPPFSLCWRQQGPPYPAGVLLDCRHTQELWPTPHTPLDLCWSYRHSSKPQRNLFKNKAFKGDSQCFPRCIKINMEMQETWTRKTRLPQRNTTDVSISAQMRRPTICLKRNSKQCKITQKHRQAITWIKEIHTWHGWEILQKIYERKVKL